MSKDYQFIDTSPVEELMPYRDIAKELNCSASLVVRIEKQALKKLRKILVDDPRVSQHGRTDWLPSLYE
jgi:hypothetical protein